MLRHAVVLSTSVEEAGQDDAAVAPFVLGGQAAHMMALAALVGTGTHRSAWYLLHMRRWFWALVVAA
ncbi:hypothetical protein WJX77_000607 [Trebouxia sp. C0004]